MTRDRRTETGAKRKGRPSRRALLRGLAAGLGIVVVSGVLLGDRFVGSSAVAVEDAQIDAAEAARRAAAGELVIVDVRRPEEWRETGLPAPAEGISLHTALGLQNPDFEDEVRKLLDGDLDKPVAFICAAGVRSAVARELAAEGGLSNAVHIVEGMFGNRHGPGWLARDLPLAPCGDC